MSGKFMKVKRILIPTITMAIIASQLMGCSALTQSELLKWINDGQQIEIEVVNPSFYQDEQGEESILTWIELAQLETNPALRSSWDDILLITRTDTGKNGIFYVNEAGENENNNTLAVAIHNREFQKIFDNDSTMRSLANAAVNNYADLEINDTNNRNELIKAVYMGINAYFNLLPDNIPNYCNADSTLTRAEFMTMVFRADTPVSDLASDGILTNAVGQSEYNIYAQGVTANSYLDLESESLNNLTYNGNITRAEVIYILVSRYYSNELQLIDVKSSGVTFSDAKDGGNIAEQQKFIENGVQKTYWKSYELTYALQNADAGLPTDLYKALVVAQQVGIINSSETRWDEACTLSEAIELLVKALMNENGITTYTAKLGTIDTGYIADNTEDSEEIEIGNGTGTLLTEEENNYLEEAQNLWTEHQDELECNEETFNEIYMGLRDSGKTPEEAYTEAYEQFKKEEESQQTVEPVSQLSSHSKVNQLTACHQDLLLAVVLVSVMALEQMVCTEHLNKH